MATVYIVRHGNTFDKGDVVLRVGGRTDLPLSSSGLLQARALAGAFADIQFDRAVVSPLKRTRMTADAILAAQTRAPHAVFSDDLIEVDYGPDEGQPEDVVVARIGEMALQAWEHDATPPPDWNVEPAALRQAWRDLLANASETELIVTSNGVARFVLDVAHHDGAARKLKTGAYGVLDGTGSDWRVVAWNVRPS